MSAASAAAWERFREWTGTLSDLAGIAALGGWDRETLMPSGGSDARATQSGTLAALHHRELVRPDMSDVLARLLEEREGRPEADAAMLRLAMRARERAERLPERLVRGISEACSRSVSAWTAARRGGDTAAFATALADVVALKRREAEAIGVGHEPYDALLDEYEPDTRVADLEPVFADLRARLTPLVEAASERPDVTLPAHEWDADAQMALAVDIAEMMGFDRDRGVIARSEHPFTSSPHRGDVRFTTRVDPASPIENIGAVMHELGHALYEQGLPAEAARTPVHDAPSLGAHESQSRFWENHIGLRGGFWSALEPVLRRHFPEAMAGIDHELLHRAANVVRPSPIRVGADEVTYNLHIVLRFELEVALIRGDLPVADLPGAFADGMERLLGIRPATDAQGSMQDIHWADGLFGYFPTYTLGNLYAAQLAEVADRELGGLDAAVERGRFTDILAFMRDRVHRHGAMHPTPELMRRATGRELSADALIEHLARSHRH